MQKSFQISLEDLHKTLETWTIKCNSITMNSKEKRRKFEINEEDDNSKVYESMWSWDPVCFLVKDEDDRSNEWSFGIAKKLNVIMEFEIKTIYDFLTSLVAWIPWLLGSMRLLLI